MVKSIKDRFVSYCICEECLKDQRFACYRFVGCVKDVVGSCGLCAECLKDLRLFPFSVCTMH